MNVNFYCDKWCELQAVEENYKYRFYCKIYHMPILSFKTYSTEKGALKAGRNWIRQYIHDDMP